MQGVLTTRQRRRSRVRRRTRVVAAPLLLTAGLAGWGSAAAQPLEAAGADAPSPTPARAATTPAPTTLPAGSIIAFVPAGSGFTGSDAALRDWLAERGWAICDGTRGTPDLRGRMLLGTTDPLAVGQRLGSRDHDHRVRGESEAPVLRNRHTPTGHGPLKHLPDDQHRHRLDLATDRSQHLPPSTRVLFIMKLP
ncbi:hypothetical protein [uncultured Thiohalocapsa sp.]|uniref:hypothetical protein n=1 Tax=uncultured Thiohalocapsa sp. TaxID=768990 RepID=UPI0026010E70|nr:hypothetical protein [uncultured Thiohalocapsa sp.]